MKNRIVIEKIKEEFHLKVVGQDHLLEGLLIALFSKGHVLLEGVPGVAKTLAIKTFADILGLNFKRIQFTPDLLPADILGTEIYNSQEGKFLTKKGPLFSQIILADEINRAPSKVQSALLEAMQEKQITIGDKSYPLVEPFLVLATQNPIEQEGTYILPEAQVDRFMIKIKVTYPEKNQEIQIVKNNLDHTIFKKTKSVLNLKVIEELQKEVKETYIEANIIAYIIELVEATRNLKKYGLNPDLVTWGVSPRASIYLAEGAKAHAFLQNKDFVSPDDVKEVAPLILEHRLILSYEAEAEGINKEKVINDILNKVNVP